MQKSHSGTGPNGAFRANEPREDGLDGATWPPMARYEFPLSPNGHPTMAQRSPAVAVGQPAIALAGLKTWLDASLPPAGTREDERQ